MMSTPACTSRVAKAWFAFINGNTQNPITSKIIFDKFPDLATLQVRDISLSANEATPTRLQWQRVRCRAVKSRSQFGAAGGARCKNSLPEQRREQLQSVLKAVQVMRWLTEMLDMTPKHAVILYSSSGKPSARKSSSECIQPSLPSMRTFNQRLASTVRSNHPVSSRDTLELAEASAVLLSTHRVAT
jgi:hypothetical protein